MFLLVLIALAAAVVYGIKLNHKTSRLALEGVLVKTTLPPAEVDAAITELYCGGGMGANLRAMTTGFKVNRVSPSTFRYETKYGDRGSITIKSDTGGSLVLASAETLFVGNMAGRNATSGYYAVAARMVNWFYVTCDLAPNAAKLKRFQAGIEGRLRKKLGPAAVPPILSTATATPAIAALSRNDAPAAPVRELAAPTHASSVTAHAEAGVRPTPAARLEAKPPAGRSDAVPPPPLAPAPPLAATRETMAAQPEPMRVPVPTSAPADRPAAGDVGAAATRPTPPQDDGESLWD